MNWKLILLLMTMAAQARAQSPFLRQSDARTMTPETIMGERKDWGAELSMGGNLNRGNVDINYFSSGFSVYKAWKPLTAYLSGSMAYNAFGGRRVLNQGSLTARVDRRVSGPWKIFAFNTNAYNEFLRLDQRTTVGAGPWYDLAAGPTRHGLSLALTQVHERFKGGIVENAAFLSLRSLSRIPISQTAELRGDFYYCPKIKDSADYLAYAEVSLNSLIWKDVLGLRVAWINEYDSRPKPGVRSTDIMWLTSLTLRFGK